MSIPAWNIPGKTFVLGEYAALQGLSALIATTGPCFSLQLTQESGLQGISPLSPAGRYWQNLGLEQGLIFSDPYQGQGGLGASSAQFIGCYQAVCFLKNQAFDLNSLLQTYYDYAWNGQGLKPSGYDIIAQTQRGLVQINQHQSVLKQVPWSFKTLGFQLLHTGVKLATHSHLQESRQRLDYTKLGYLAEQGLDALQQVNLPGFLSAINETYTELDAMNLVSPHTQELVEQLTRYPEILAIKGCGAMGSDVVLVLYSLEDQTRVNTILTQYPLNKLATQDDLFY